MQSTHNNSGKTCCVAAAVQVDLWLSHLSMRLQILRNTIQLEKPWVTPRGGNRFLYHLHPCFLCHILWFFCSHYRNKKWKSKERLITKASHDADPKVFMPVTTCEASDGPNDIQKSHKSLHKDIFSFDQMQHALVLWCLFKSMRSFSQILNGTHVVIDHKRYKDFFFYLFLWKNLNYESYGFTDTEILSNYILLWILT